MAVESVVIKGSVHLDKLETVETVALHHQVKVVPYLDMDTVLVEVHLAIMVKDRAVDKDKVEVKEVAKVEARVAVKAVVVAVGEAAPTALNTNGR